jgi:hypothetical protein
MSQPFGRCRGGSETRCCGAPLPDALAALVLPPHALNAPAQSPVHLNPMQRRTLVIRASADPGTEPPKGQELEVGGRLVLVVLVAAKAGVTGVSPHNTCPPQDTLTIVTRT